MSLCLLSLLHCIYALIVLQLTKVERISQKLHIMSFIGNFFDTYHHLQPVREVWTSFSRMCKQKLVVHVADLVQDVSGHVIKCSCMMCAWQMLLQQLHAVIAASISVKNSSKIRKLIEVCAILQ